jgi:CRISPR/Cas system CSM-associated protein Csm3 (group 7 of RAMP superfamily)
VNLVKVSITYRLEFFTPVHVGTGTGGRGFLDKYLYRQWDHYDKKDYPVIPGSTIKGRLRAAVTALARARFYGTEEVCREVENCSCLICLIFGRAGHQRGHMYFEDARAINNDIDRWTAVRTGIAIDRHRQVARDNALYSMETTGGKNVFFKGQIWGWVPEEKQQTIISALKDAIAFSYALGSGKSRGLGWFQAQIVEEGVKNAI